MNSKTKINVNKRLDLAKKFLKFILKEPNILRTLPDEAEVVLLSEEDSELSAENFEFALKGKDLKNLLIFKSEKISRLAKV